ncbi:MAG TPA: methionyl-tRNA formyltransferase [Flavobacteriales bacterium]|nr:methionyl-tRNA formyltransferase [Flavobacteriales bacterium]
MRISLKIVFMGTPEFAVDSLDIIVAQGYDVVAVITAPDKPAGRGQIMKQSAVKEYAISKGLKVLQPNNLKDPGFQKDLQALNANLQVVVAFRMLPKAIWEMPEFGTFNLHASLLPNYRGAAPINWAIINGEKETGVTTFFLKQEIDTGDIIFQEKVPVPEEGTAGQLHDQLKELGSSLVLKTVNAIAAGDYQISSQAELMHSDSPLKTAKKIYKHDCKINWEKDIDGIYNQIRGLSPYPGAWTEIQSIDNKSIILKIFKVNKVKDSNAIYSGSILVEKSTISIPVNGGQIFLEEVQISGKRRLQIGEFLRGTRIDNNWKIN